MLHDMNLNLKLKKRRSYTRVTEDMGTRLGIKLDKTERKEYSLLAYCFIITLNNINKSERMVLTYGLLHGDLLTAPVVLALIAVWTAQNVATRCISLPISVCQCFTGYWFSVTFRRICVFTASSDSRFVSFFALSTSLSHCISGLAFLFLLLMENGLERKSGNC